MFTSDHGLTTDCEGVGHGDSAIYPGGGRRDRRADQGAEPAREPDDHALRHPPQHARLLGHDGERHARREQRLLRQRHRDRHRLVLRGRPPRLPAGRRDVREQPDLLEQLQQLRGGLRRGAEGAGAGGRRDLHRGRQRQRDPRQPLLRQLAPRHDADQRARTRCRTRRDDRQLGLPPQPLPRQRDGNRAGRRQDAERRGLLVGRGAGPGGQLLVRQRRRSRPTRPAR